MASEMFKKLMNTPVGHPLKFASDNVSDQRPRKKKKKAAFESREERRKRYLTKLQQLLSPTEQP